MHDEWTQNEKQIAKTVFPIIFSSVILNTILRFIIELYRGKKNNSIDRLDIYKKKAQINGLNSSVFFSATVIEYCNLKKK